MLHCERLTNHLLLLDFNLLIWVEFINICVIQWIQIDIYYICLINTKSGWKRKWELFNIVNHVWVTIFIYPIVTKIFNLFNVFDGVVSLFIITLEFVNSKPFFLIEIKQWWFLFFLRKSTDVIIGILFDSFLASWKIWDLDLCNILNASVPPSVF